MAAQVQPVGAETLPFLAGRLQRDPELVDRIVTRGLIAAPQTPAADPDAFVWASVELRNRLMELAASDPLAAERLGLRPLDVLCCEDKCEVPCGQTLAVAFSDLEGFTRFTLDYGDVAAESMLHDHYEAVEAIVAGHGGSVVKKIGDGHMMCFDKPESAVLAAIETVRAATLPLPARVGVHFGSVVQTDDDLVGHVVNLAARLTDVTPGGTSFVTVDVREAVGDLPGVRFDEPVEFRVRGLADAVMAYAAHPV